MQGQDFTWVSITMVIIVICFLMEKKCISLKLIKKMLTSQFCLESISNGFGAADSRGVSLKENVYDFSVNYNALDKSDIWNIHKYLMVKNDNVQAY